MKMETKSRYEVIADLEQQRRDLITQKNSLNEEVLKKEKVIKLKKRQMDDLNRQINRELEDLEEDLENFKNSLDEKKETIKELIMSVDGSLEKFNAQGK